MAELLCKYVICPDWLSRSPDHLQLGLIRALLLNLNMQMRQAEPDR